MILNGTIESIFFKNNNVPVKAFIYLFVRFYNYICEVQWTLD